MIKGFLAQKLRIEQHFDKEGNLVPVTILRALPCLVVQIKSLSQDGYWAVQIGSGVKKKINKPLKGHLRKAKTDQFLAILREVGGEEEKIKKLKLGQAIKMEDVFEPGELVNIEGESKGRGFAGVIKRWGFASQPKTHGQSDRERAPGSIGAQTPGRVFKGKKMPGRHGGRTVTVGNLEVLHIDSKNNEILIKGSVPGATKSWLMIKKIGKKSKRFIPLAENSKRGKENEKKN